LPTLLGDDAPTRAIVCAGAGHFACANVTLTQGAYLGSGVEASERVQSQWERIAERKGDLVPQYGFVQVEREVASAAQGLMSPIPLQT
jgi:hypothetical protein